MLNPLFHIEITHSSHIPFISLHIRLMNKITMYLPQNLQLDMSFLIFIDHKSGKIIHLLGSGQLSVWMCGTNVVYHCNGTELSSMLGVQNQWLHKCCTLAVYLFSLFLYINFQDFQVDVYFRQRWTDHRLAFDGQEAPVILSARSLEKIWIPDLFFPNEKSASYHEITVQNQVINIFPNGTVRYSSR